MKKKINTIIIKNTISQFKNDGYLLYIITKVINQLDKINPVWNNVINEIITINISPKFIYKIKIFSNNIINKNYLLILHLLLETYITIIKFPTKYRDKSFYVILNELVHIINNNDDNDQDIYKKGLIFLNKFKDIIKNKDSVN